MQTTEIGMIQNGVANFRVLFHVVNDGYDSPALHYPESIYRNYDSERFIAAVQLTLKKWDLDYRQLEY